MKNQKNPVLEDIQQSLAHSELKEDDFLAYLERGQLIKRGYRSLDAVWVHHSDILRAALRSWDSTAAAIRASMERGPK